MTVVISGTTGITLPDNGGLSTSAGTALSVDSGGRVRMPKQPRFSVSPTSDITGAGNNIHQVIIFDEVIYNIGSHYNASTGAFTAPVDGVYLFTGNIRFNNVGATYHNARFYKNGIHINDESYVLSQDTGSYNTLTLVSIIELVAGDAITTDVYVSGDSTWSISHSSNFAGHLIS